MGSNREKQFAKNTVILTVGSLSSKLFTFFLLPLYTSVLTTEDYGNVDVLQSIIQLALPIVSLQLGASLFRFLIDKNTFEDKREIVTSSILLIIANSIMFLMGSLVLNIFIPIQYYPLFVTSFVALTSYTILQNIARGLGHNLLYSVSSFLTVFVSLILNIVLIVGIHLKGESILIALTISNFVAALVIAIKEQIWVFFSPKCFSKTRLKELLGYSLPLVPNELSWWIANSSDRLLILMILGSGFNGIYAVANKIPNIYTTFHSVFNVAWLESVSRCVDDPDCETFISGMVAKFYSFYGCLCIGIICSTSVFFELLVGTNYSAAYPHVYILILAIFINSICATYGGIFGAFKDSKTIGSTTVFGAVVNITVNLIAINHMGLFAASISTLISYLVVLIIRMLKVRKYIKIFFPIAYLFRFLSFLFVVTIGYFTAGKTVNALILVGVAIWSYIENRKMVNSIVYVLIKKVKAKR